MTKQAKILKSEFKSEWNNPKGGVLYYHDVVLEGEGDKPWNIGSTSQNPDFLQVGQTLAYEVTDESKRKIKRVKVEAPAGGGYQDNSLGMQIGNALNVTATLIAHGKVELKDLESVARRVVEISKKLKEEFK